MTAEPHKPILKYCAGCKAWLAVDLFHVDHSERGLHSGGRQRLCKKCKQEWRDRRITKNETETRGRHRITY